MMSGKYIVLKFGSSVLQNKGDLSTASHEIYRYIREGYKVLAVVSAMGDKTDVLLNKASEISSNPSKLSKAFLLATGEQQSTAFLTMNLEEIGIPTRPIDPREIEFLAEGQVDDATPIDVNTEKLFSLFKSNDVLVLPGFYAGHKDFGISLLGRGGSDFSAIFLASKIGVGCRVRLLKDVDGLYERDPSQEGPQPRRFKKVRWGNAIKVAGVLVQPKAIEFAKERAQHIEVAKCNDNKETIIGTEGPIYDSPIETSAPLKVGLLGLGTVGFETYKYLKGEAEKFKVVGIAVRDLEKHKTRINEAELLTTNISEVLDKKPDILIEAIGGLEQTFEILSKALENGAHIVSANKDLFAKYGDKLQKLSKSYGGKLQFSAAVGGGLPVLEIITKAANEGDVKSIEGVVNGTTNFIIGKLEEGVDFKDALKEAQDLGFAEANPDNDILGWDAVFKLTICSEIAFGKSPFEQDIIREGITELTSDKLKSLLKDGKTIRHVAKCWLEGERVKLSVKPEIIEQSHFLAGAKAEKNRVLLTKSNGEKIGLAGKGAGAAPTATSVFADVLKIQQDISEVGQQGILKNQLKSSA